MNEAKKPPKFYRRWYFIAPLAVILALLLTAVTAMLLLFSPVPNYQPDQLTSTQLKIHGVVLNRIMADMVKSKPDTIREIILDETEVNAIFVLAENGQRLANFFSPRNDNGKVNIKPQNYKLLFKNGILIVNAAVDTHWRTPAGSYIALRIAGTPAITAANADFVISSATAGIIPIPKSMVQKIITDNIPKIKNEEYFKIARDIIVTMNITADNKLQVSYYPYRARKYLMRSLNF
jgi:hypothetical protein